jgi:hypothetical protein
MIQSVVDTVSFIIFFCHFFTIVTSNWRSCKSQFSSYEKKAYDWYIFMNKNIQRNSYEWCRLILKCHLEFPGCILQWSSVKEPATRHTILLPCVHPINFGWLDKECVTILCFMILFWMDWKESMFVRHAVKFTIKLWIGWVKLTSIPSILCLRTSEISSIVVFYSSHKIKLNLMEPISIQREPWITFDRV